MTLLDYVEIDPLSTIGNGITLVDLAPVSLSVRPSFILSDFHSVSVSEPSQSVETTLWWPTWWLTWQRNLT